MKNPQLKNIAFRKVTLTLSIMAVLLAACSKKEMASSYMAESSANVASVQAVAADSTAKMVAPAPSPTSVYGTEENTEKYQKTETNSVKSVGQEPISTFSIDVDMGSYTNVRRFLNEGSLPPKDAVRVEEMVNYFDYQYPNPTSAHPFSVNTETVDSPWQANAKVIRIGIKAKDIDSKQLPPVNLVFLVDISGSMSDQNKLPLVKKTLKLLTEQLRAQDQVTLITYADGEKMVLEPTLGSNKSKILAAIDTLQAGGATAGEQAIQMAYKSAQKSFVKNGINRILLATDGDFNVGITDFDTLKNMVAEKRKSGISLSTFGYGSGNYDEQLMEQLADAGDGNYSYIDNDK